MRCFRCGGYRTNPPEFNRQTFRRVQEHGPNITLFCPYMAHQTFLNLDVPEESIERLQRRQLDPDFSTLELIIYANVPDIQNEPGEEIWWVVSLADMGLIGYGKLQFDDEHEVWKTYAAYIAFQGLGIYPAILREIRHWLGPFESQISLSPGAKKAWERAGGVYHPTNAHRGYYSINPVDVATPGIHHLKNQTMWWAAKGPARVKCVPKFKGLGMGGNKPKRSDYTESEWEVAKKFYEFNRWVEEIFEEVRLEVNPEAPSRINNLMLCPELSGFCREPSGYAKKYGRSHVYEVSVTGKAFTTNSEIIGTAKQYGAEELSRGRDFLAKLDYWKDPERMTKARNVVKRIAKDYWMGQEAYSPETIVDGKARIIKQVTEWD